MRGYLAFDTSNYTTSVALWQDGAVLEERRLLLVRPGELGLRQSDAVFAHVRALGELTECLTARSGGKIAAVGCSSAPRPAKDSYMPCFLVGTMAARAVAGALGVACFSFSHQAGHLAAALFGAGRLDLFDDRFLAFHVSGGTTECVLVKSLRTEDIRILSHTADLNAGQLIDRVGLMLGLDFPAGIMLDGLSRQSEKHFSPNAAFHGDDPCLSGVENQCRAMLERNEAPCDGARFCLDCVFAAIDGMAGNAVQKTGCETILFSGGVMSNTILCEGLSKKYGGAIFAPGEYCRDSAIGTAVLTAKKVQEGDEKEAAAWR
jgi:N6-L-threonylcarbamoyladenine synthase